MKEKVNLKGHWRIEIWENGKCIRVIDKDNTLTTAYRQGFLTQLAGDISLDMEIKYLAVGTDSTASTQNDTRLGAEVFRSSPTSVTVNSGYTRTIWVLTNEQANYNLREVGVFIGLASASPNTGTLMSRINININKTDSQEIMFIRDDYINI